MGLIIASAEMAIIHAQSHHHAHLTGLLCSNVSHKSCAALDCSDWVQVNTNNQAAHGHVLDSNLEPSSCAYVTGQISWYSNLVKCKPLGKHSLICVRSLLHWVYSRLVAWDQ